ncbi:MAG: uncharacterized protein KVP18_002986 [Porospora cf. gigantea A]|nr:MAG: hypothetical protein KVP18_002986 [Porospora cf. gigantea A]
MYPEGKIVVDLDTDTKAPSQDESMEKMMQSVMEKIREEIRKYKKPQEMHNFDPLFEDSPVSLKDSTEKPKPYGEDEAPESVKPQDMATQQESEVELNTLHVGQRLRHAI